MANKSPDAFRTISEVAQDLDIKQHVLRFWESKFPQVKPVKRAGGRRYYRPDDVILLRRIRDLLYQDGYTIKGVQKLLKDFGPKAVAAGAISGGRDAPSGDDLFTDSTIATSTEAAVEPAEEAPPSPQSQFAFDQKVAPPAQGRTLGGDAIDELRGILVELREMKALMSQA